MTQAIDLKAGNAFQKDGKLIKVLETNHHKPGKGNTVMQMKLFDIRSGAIVQTTMRPTEKVELAVLDRKKAQFLYTQDDTAFFMDLESYEQYEIPTTQIAHELQYMLPNTNVEIEFFGSEVIGVTLPGAVDLKVIETQPSVKGGTVAGGGKPATMETGLVVTVPDFVQPGEVLTITTANGEYRGRAQS